MWFIVIIVVFGAIGLGAGWKNMRRLRARDGLSKPEFTRQLEDRGISARVASEVFDYYSGLVGGQVKLLPSDSREELAGSGPEDYVDDARLILQELSLAMTFDEVKSLLLSRSPELRSLEEVARFVQLALDRRT